jgi:pyruvate dehydrogenase E2 component (dihydrolipoamide acetyltransferase)
MEFKLPDIGEGLEEGEIVKWLVKAGDVVKADQNIVQVETDKAVADLPAPVGGKMLKINFKEGDTVKVGQVLCVIGDSGEKVEDSAEEEPKTEVSPQSSSEETGGTEQKAKEDSNVEPKSQVDVNKSGKVDLEIVEQPQSEAFKGEAATEKVQALPAVRKLARDKGVDLSTVKGSGPGGRIVEADLGQGAGEKTAEPVAQQKLSVKRKYDDFGYIEHVPLKGIRKTIAKNMIKSQTDAAQVTAMDDIDVTKLWNLRKEEKQHFELEGIKLTFLPFIVKAVIAALKENPTLNASIVGEEIIVKKYYNIGVAVETEVGLMVPVIKIAEKKSIATIAKEIGDLAEKARSRKIDVMDLKGGCFTITNYGSIGGNYGTPIINPPEAAILGLGRIFDRAVLDEKTGKMKNVKILPVSLTFDHRILDGAQSARFLESLKMFLTDPDHLFKSGGGIKSKDDKSK